MSSKRWRVANWQDLVFFFSKQFSSSYQILVLCLLGNACIAFGRGQERHRAGGIFKIPCLWCLFTKLGEKVRETRE